MAKKDLVLAAASGYSWEQINVWALSLIETGFKGIGVVILYDDPSNPNPANKLNIEYLQSIGIQVIVMPLRGSIFNQRFGDFYEVMYGALTDLRYAIVTDIRDVYFQSDPTVWLKQNMKKSFLAVSEAIRYRDEPWGSNNVRSGFPTLAHRVMDKCIYNVGVLAGDARAIADLCLSISIVAKSTSFQIADQSGYNLLLDMHPFRNAVQLCESEDGFACQAGTVADPSKIEQFRPLLLEPEPILDNDGVKTSGGLLYPIVHQYDRVPAWDNVLRGILNEKLNAPESLTKLKSKK